MITILIFCFLGLIVFGCPGFICLGKAPSAIIGIVLLILLILSLLGGRLSSLSSRASNNVEAGHALVMNGPQIR